MEVRIARIGSVVGSVLLIAITSACASAHGAASGSGPAISNTQAEQVLGNYLRVNARAVATQESSLVTTVATGTAAQISQTGVEFERYDATPPVATISRPVFLFPRFRGYPRWFAVFGVNRGRETMALVFQESRQGAPWLAAAAVALLGPGIPKIAVDSSGYATAVVGTAPDDAVTAHLSCLNSVNGSGSCSDMVPGNWTTGIVTRMKQTTIQPWRLGATWTAASDPVFALRMADGGTFIWYSLTEDGTAVNRGDGHAVPLTKLQKLLTGLATVKHSYDFQSQYQFTAEIQPTGKIAITGQTHLLMKAQGS